MKVICKDCNKEFEAVRITKKRCPECHKEANKIWKNTSYVRCIKSVESKRVERRISAKEWYHENKEYASNRINKYHQVNAESRRERSRERYNTNPLVRIKCNYRSIVYHALKRQLLKKDHNSEELCGCTWENLMKHLENRFTEGMSWNNQGEWHIDHIKPCASFNLLDPVQLKECFHYTNLQPLWGEDNIRKNSFYNGVKYYHQNAETVKQ